MKKIIVFMLCAVLMASSLSVAFAKTESEETVLSVSDVDESLYEGVWVTVFGKGMMYVPKAFTVTEGASVVFSDPNGGVSFTVSNVSEQYKSLDAIVEQYSKEDVEISKAVINGMKAIMFYSNENAAVQAVSLNENGLCAVSSSSASKGNIFYVFIELKDGNLMSVLFNQGKATDDEFSKVIKNVTSSISISKEAASDKENNFVPNGDTEKNEESPNGSDVTTGDNFVVQMVAMLGIVAVLIGAGTYAVKMKKVMNK